MTTIDDLGPFELLKRLCETPGVSGREERIRDLLLAETDGLWDETTIDPMGNLICLKRATRKPPRRKPASRATSLPTDRPPRVMLACHMDEIGFYVRHIDDTGFVRVQNVGAFDARNLFARRVIVHGRKDLPGTLNPVGKPVHIAAEEDKKKIPSISEFAIDLGLTKSEIIKQVEIGDPVTLYQETVAIGDGICGKALDNRAALWTTINAIRRTCGQPATRGSKRQSSKRTTSSPAGSPYDIYFVASVQEEVGVRGAITSAYNVDPDIGIAIDVTLCCDTPGVSPDDVVTRFGQGVAIKIMDGYSISDRGLVDEFIKLATRRRIPFQREIMPRGGTDAGALQRSRAGKRVITLSIPTRYLHTVVETMHRRDAQAAVDLLAAWLAG